jgi:hypothetical protein
MSALRTTLNESRQAYLQHEQMIGREMNTLAERAERQRARLAKLHKSKITKVPKKPAKTAEEETETVAPVQGASLEKMMSMYLPPQTRAPLVPKVETVKPPEVPKKPETRAPLVPKVEIVEPREVRNYVHALFSQTQQTYMQSNALCFQNTFDYGAFSRDLHGLEMLHNGMPVLPDIEQQWNSGAVSDKQQLPSEKKGDFDSFETNEELMDILSNMHGHDMGTTADEEDPLPDYTRITTPSPEYTASGYTPLNKLLILGS